MAMFKCPKCGRQISDKGTICPGCMTPMSELVSASQTPKKERIGCTGCLILALAAFGGFMLMCIVGMFLFSHFDIRPTKSGPDAADFEENPAIVVTLHTYDSIEKPLCSGRLFQNEILLVC